MASSYGPHNPSSFSRAEQGGKGACPPIFSTKKEKKGKKKEKKRGGKGEEERKVEISTNKSILCPFCLLCEVV